MTRFRFQIISGFLLIIILLLTSLGIFTGKLLENTFVDTLSDRLEKEAFIISTNLYDEETKGIIDGNLEEKVKIWSKAGDGRLTIIDLEGVVLADSEVPYQEMENHLNREEVRQALEKGVGHSMRASSTTGQDMIYVAVPILGDQEVIGAVRISYPIQEVKSKVHHLWVGQIIGLLIALALFTLLGTRIARNLTEPIEKIIEVALDITKQRFGKKVNVTGKGEITDLAKAINFMSESLESQMIQIKEEKRRLSDILRNMDSGVILVNQEGRIVLANRGITQILGVNETEIVGLLHHETTKSFGLSKLIDRVLTHHHKVHEEIHLYYPMEKIVDVNLAPQFDELDQFTGVVMVLHDITHIRRLEKIRNDFVANVSHELKTPVTAIHGFTETLLDGALENQETLTTFLEIIHTESERLQRLINDILDLSKIEQKRLPLDYKAFSIEQIVDEVLAYFSKELVDKGIKFEKRIPDDFLLEADRDRIKQILINLVANALQYTPEHGEIWLEAHKHHKTVILVVGDTGIGIPKEDLHRIFERFYRVDKARSRNSGGTGLGLAIVKHLVESHNGRIWAESEEGKGTQFYVELPR